jgi:hypothetical protein
MSNAAEHRDPSLFAELMRIIDQSPIAHGDLAARALSVVRDGVLTGEGPTADGRAHFSRTIDTDDAKWCDRILKAAALDDQPVSRAEAEILFAIDDAGADRTDDGHFDELFARAIVHHAASASGLPVPKRGVALSSETPIESWAPTKAVGVDTEVLEWIISQVKGKRRRNSTLMSAITTVLVGAATLPLIQALGVLSDLGF